MLFYKLLKSQKTAITSWSQLSENVEMDQIMVIKFIFLQKKKKYFLLYGSNKDPLMRNKIVWISYSSLF